MPYTKDDQWNLPLYFQKVNKVAVIINPATARAFKKRRIPIDGREYDCGGIVELKNGIVFRASFTINTLLKSFIIFYSVFLHKDDLWYRWNEPQLLSALDVKETDMFSFKWNPYRPLNTNAMGSFP